MSRIHSMGRRSLLRSLVGVVAGGRAAVDMSTKAVLGQYDKVGLAGALDADHAADRMPPMVSIAPGGLFKNAIRRALDAAQQEYWDRASYKVNGFHPNILALNLPVATLARLQREQDERALGRVDRFRKKLGLRNRF